MCLANFNRPMVSREIQNAARDVDPQLVAQGLVDAASVLSDEHGAIKARLHLAAAVIHGLNEQAKQLSRQLLTRAQ